MNIRGARNEVVMPVTLREIAQEAGVSYQAVSAVLNNSIKVRVSPEKRQRIMQLVEEMGYHPNIMAQRLVNKKNNVIGLIIDSMAPIFYRNVLMVVERLIFEKGFRLQVGLVHDNFASLKKYVDDFLGFGIDNVICMAHSYPDFADLVPPLFDKFPNVVFMEEPFDTASRWVVAADHYAVYKETVKYLLGLNRTRIINCRDVYRDKAFYASSQGFADGFREAGVEYRDEFMFYYPAVEITSYDAAEKLIDLVMPLRPDALILPHDESTMWCYQVLKKRRIAVPEQISLVSGDLWKFGKAFSPPLAGIEYDYEGIARRCVEILLDNLGDREERVTIPSLDLFVAHFVPGQSVVPKTALKQ